MTTYIRINPDRNDIPVQDALLVMAIDPPKQIIDTTSSATYNYICESMDDNALDTDPTWRIQRFEKASPMFFKWAVDSVTNKATSAFKFKATDRTNLNFA
jgi:hypothetical protein